MTEFADMGSILIGGIGLGVIAGLILFGIGARVYSRQLRSIVRSWAYLAVLGLLLLAWLVDAIFRLGIPPQWSLVGFAALLIFKIAVEVLAPTPLKRRAGHSNSSELFYGGASGDGGDGLIYDSGAHSGGADGGGDGGGGH